MAASQTTISNLALGKLGSRRIMEPGEDSAEANFCREFFEQTRDELIASYRWNFAATRATLSLLSTVPLFGWSYQYALPADCLRVVELNQIGWDAQGFADAFVIEQKNMLTNQATANIRYLARITDCSMYPPLFIEALAMKLAAVICKPLTGSAEQTAQLLQILPSIIGKAVQTNAIEGKPRRRDQWEESRHVQSRWGGPGAIG